MKKIQTLNKVGYIKIELQKNYNVLRLQQWLDYELSTAALLFLSYFWRFTLLIIIIVAVLFTPFMLKILFEEKRFGWIFFSIILVILPAVIFLFLRIDSSYKIILELIPLALFYFYCFLLRLSVKSW